MQPRAALRGSVGRWRRQRRVELFLGAAAGLVGVVVERLQGGWEVGVGGGWLLAGEMPEGGGGGAEAHARGGDVQVLAGAGEGALGEVVELGGGPDVADAARTVGEE